MLTAEDFVRVLYRGVLGREPDDAGFAHHVAALGTTVGIEPAIAALGGFLDSAEFHQRRSPSDVLAALRIPPSGPPFAHVASLGSDCYASKTLQLMGLKRYSLPFDWIFSSLAMVAHCIEDQFATLLDPRQYRPNPPKPGILFPRVGLCDHRFYYGEFRVECVFNHYDPSELAAYAYLIRAVGRLRRLLASTDRKLFIATFKARRTALLEQEFAHLVQVLDAHTTNAQLMAIAILPSSGTGDFSHTVLRREGVHTLCVLQPLSTLEAITFGDPLDEVFVRRLIAAHAFDLAPTI